jgi:Ca-activated chloride channel family protein
MLEVEVPGGKARDSRQVADVKVTYANLETKTTDRLASTISVNFSESQAECDKKTNKDVAAACALQVANAQSKLATELRDKGDLEGAKRLLTKNRDYLFENARRYDAPALRERGEDNAFQAGKLGDADWSKSRKIMRGQQYSDSVQQKFEGTKR